MTDEHLKLANEIAITTRNLNAQIRQAELSGLRVFGKANEFCSLTGSRSSKQTRIEIELLQPITPHLETGGKS